MVRPKRTLDDAISDFCRSFAAKKLREADHDARKADFLAAEKQQDEDEAAEEWYRERRDFESFLISRQRHDHLLPEDEQLPF